jgi:FAD dependent oxidoreductase TIGR03364
MMGRQRFDDAVVGAGILGLAHAYHLARRGRRVIVFERTPRAMGASVRNFGMLWPIGQPLGPLRQLAMRSLQFWLEVLASSGQWHERTGSLHLAYRDDEAQVLREFAQEMSAHGQIVELQKPDHVRQRRSAVKLDGLQLALWSPHEVCVDPREIIAGLPHWLASRFGVVFEFGRTITAVETLRVVSSLASWSTDRVWICAGDELRLLFAQEFDERGLVRCKLQMMRSEPYSQELRIGTMLAGGLTLRHYGSFQNCPTLPALRRRVSEESPWVDRHGIHVLVSQNGLGELTIGDSHEYGASIEPFDKAEIDEYILEYLKTFVDLPTLRIASRWHGTYVKHPTLPYVLFHPLPGVTAITGVGGAGMTLSFGLAEQVVAHELGEAEGLIDYGNNSHD